VAASPAEAARDADLAFGNLIATSGDGQAAAVAVTDTTWYVVGMVIEDNGAAGGLVVS
jgi:hypothetical protein